ncbi:type I restriction endonuclease [Xanthomonas vesicatoria]|uniref:Restriction endonuclease or methylase n=2 Tax=Xanthomonas TaxID=338 RepID=A0AAJ0J080_9XANT|nr:type I restriction endonuclease [Xanthomonas vesicatoria]APO95706.1 restriction endonuclease [Xanthomonas vesicatoria]KHM91639.1 restriction endonuclease or methylase [Xanthomonas vesicatoria]KHM95930.1 restriction endonuclease or methylase [Xanthomonas vesicatoria]MCC8620825.1 type I restriction enzyme HsdR N-terminal domain-containing protein [Xanthomonas vesicatoria]MCC8692564.1 type I restriction enzyme HsdR N-terminal domain-containing protein [Xanthomonas vesicatoria]
MDFVDQLRVLATRISTTRALIQTEEATKNAMVMPLIQILGYNVFDPLEVTPEIVADVGTKKGEKVDYAILRDGKPIILFECKKAGAELSINHASQLFRYFHVTAARFGVLTNGLVYRFFTDLEQPNKMDEKPFFEFNVLDFKDRDVEELKKFAKSAFDLQTILTTANELKYTRAIQTRLTELMHQPTEDFVKLVSAELIGSRRFTPAIREQFTTITRRAFEQLVSERINERLKGAMAPEAISIHEYTPSIVSEQAASAASNLSSDNTVITTPEEIEGFHVVRAIVRELVPGKRVFMRDAQSYCAVLLDDNNRKPICRIRFDNLQKLRIGVFNQNKEEEQIDISSIDDIYGLADKIKEAVAAYLPQEA